MYREMVTNEDGEPLGFDYHYDDEPEYHDGYDDDGYGPEDYYDEPDTDLMYEYEPNPYDGTCSEE